jgi:hypothetical protein
LMQSCVRVLQAEVCMMEGRRPSVVDDGDSDADSDGGGEGEGAED